MEFANCQYLSRQPDVDHAFQYQKPNTIRINLQCGVHYTLHRAAPNRPIRQIFGVNQTKKMIRKSTGTTYERKWMSLAPNGGKCVLHAWHV